MRGGLGQSPAHWLLSWQLAASIKLSPITKMSTRPSFAEAYLKGGGSLSVMIAQHKRSLGKGEHALRASEACNKDSNICNQQHSYANINQNYPLSINTSKRTQC